MTGRLMEVDELFRYAASAEADFVAGGHSAGAPIAVGPSVERPSDYRITFATSINRDWGLRPQTLTRKRVPGAG